MHRLRQRFSSPLPVLSSATDTSNLCIPFLSLASSASSLEWEASVRPPLLGLGHSAAPMSSKVYFPWFFFIFVYIFTFHQLISCISLRPLYVQIPNSPPTHLVVFNGRGGGVVLEPKSGYNAHRNVPNFCSKPYGNALVTHLDERNSCWGYRDVVCDGHHCIWQGGEVKTAVESCVPLRFNA